MNIPIWKQVHRIEIETVSDYSQHRPQLGELCENSEIPGGMGKVVEIISITLLPNRQVLLRIAIEHV